MSNRFKIFNGIIVALQNRLLRCNEFKRSVACSYEQKVSNYSLLSALYCLKMLRSTDYELPTKITPPPRNKLKKQGKNFYPINFFKGKMKYFIKDIVSQGYRLRATTYELKTLVLLQYNMQIKIKEIK